jgi:hypothetical protein
LAAYVTRKAKAQAKMQKEEVELSESIDQIKKHHVSNIAHFDNHSSPDTALSVHHQRMARLHGDAASKAKESGNKKMADAHSAAANAHRSANGTVSAFNRAVEKTKQTFNESVNLDEISGKTLRKYLSKASDRMTDINTKADSETDSEKRKTLYKDLGKRRIGTSLARGKLTGEPYKKNPGVDNTMLRARVHAEEVELDESLNEVSKKTLGSYADKARAQRGAGKDREKGISMAVRKSTASAENPYDRGPRVRATEEAELDESVTFKKLFPSDSDIYIHHKGNRVGRIKKTSFGRGSNMYAIYIGKEKIDDVFNVKDAKEVAKKHLSEELDESITKMSSARLKFHATKKIPHGSFSNAEIEDEHDRRKKTDPNYHGVKPSLSEVTRSAIKKTVTYVGADGKSYSRNVPIKKVNRDEYGQDKIRTDESFINEAFKAGNVRLNDGSSVPLKAEDAKLLNQMFKDLNERNRKTMQSTLMMDKNGFNEILSFAREAL